LRFVSVEYSGKITIQDECSEDCPARFITFEDNPIRLRSFNDHRTETQAFRKPGTRNPMADGRQTQNPGNFAQDRERASRAGHTGGQHSSGNFAKDRERAVEAGRKGGQVSGGVRSQNATVRQAKDIGAGQKAGRFADD
jgi:general stress protein YciG